MKASRTLNWLACVAVAAGCILLLALLSMHDGSGMHITVWMATSFALGFWFWIASSVMGCLESMAESSKEACSDQTAKALLEELRTLSAEARERKRAKMASEAEAKNAGLPVEMHPGDW